MADLVAVRTEAELQRVAEAKLRTVSQGSAHPLVVERSRPRSPSPAQFATLKMPAPVSPAGSPAARTSWEPSFKERTVRGALLVERVVQCADRSA
jgi:hypothetical protein